MTELPVATSPNILLTDSFKEPVGISDHEPHLWYSVDLSNTVFDPDKLIGDIKFEEVFRRQVPSKTTAYTRTAPPADWKVLLTSQDWAAARNLIRTRLVHGPAWQSELEDRLAELKEAAAEDGVPFSQASAEMARRFCRRSGRSTRPSIFHLDNGNVRLLWENERGEQVGLQFRPELHAIQCVIFKLRSDGMARFTIMDTPEGLPHLITDNGLMHLFG